MEKITNFVYQWEKKKNANFIGCALKRDHGFLQFVTGENGELH